MYIVFDIGGTNMRVAAATKESVGEVRKVPTPKDLTETITVLSSIGKELAPSIEGAAGCIPGEINKERGIYDAHNRPEWNGRHIDTELAEALGVPVTVGHDCAVIGVGEFYSGAGKGSLRMAYATVSTGVGAALIVEGQMVPPDDFFLGHVALPGGELEGLVSGTAVRKKFGIEPKDLESLDERNTLADILAAGLIPLCEKWNPDTIVLGGSMIVGVNPIPLDRVMATLATLMQNPPVIKMAELKDSGGLEGGRILAAQNA